MKELTLVTATIILIHAIQSENEVLTFISFMLLSAVLFNSLVRKVRSGKIRNHFLVKLINSLFY